MLLTNHAHVLLAVADLPDIRVDEIGARVGITNRQTLSILRDLEDEGYLVRTRVGRRTHYTVEPDRPFRHPALAGHTVAALFDAFLVDAEAAS